MSNSNLTIVAKIVVKPENLKLVEEELIKLVKFTRAEEGCVDYILHKDNENENSFLFYENWETRELWQEHMKSAHIAEYRKATEGMIEEFTISEMTQIG